MNHPSTVIVMPKTELDFKALTFSEKCERGCLLVNGICPIQQNEWERALKADQERKMDISVPRGNQASPAALEKRKWQQRAVILSLLTILYGVAEGTIGLVLGSETVSISLLAFGADSWIEVISGSLVCWRFYDDLRTPDGTTAKRTATQKERITTLTIGLLLSLLAVAVIAGSIGALVIHEQPESGVANIIIGCFSIAYMGTLYILKTRVGISLKSSTVEADAQCSLACVQLSLVLLVGAIIFREVSSVWWFDSATAIVIALMIGKEGVETVRASQKKDFSGAGCGCEGEDDGLLMRKRLKVPSPEQKDGCQDNCHDDDCEGKESITSKEGCNDSCKNKSKEVCNDGCKTKSQEVCNDGCKTKSQEAGNDSCEIKSEEVCNDGCQSKDKEVGHDSCETPDFCDEKHPCETSRSCPIQSQCKSQAQLRTPEPCCDSKNSSSCHDQPSCARKDPVLRAENLV